MLVGLTMIPLPGPGPAGDRGGLAVLALEFAWAERLLERTVERMSEPPATGASARARGRQQAVSSVLGAARRAAHGHVAYAWDIPLLPV